MRELWLRSYPDGVRPDVDLNEYASVNEILARSCDRFRERPSFRNLGATITYQDLDRLSRDFAACLQSFTGLEKGSRVALMLPNLLQYPVAFFGCLRAGMIVVNVNPLYTARELELQLADSGAKAIVVLENFAHVLEKVLQRTDVQHVITTQVGDLLPMPRRALVNFAVKRVKKMVPRWRMPGTVPLSVALQRGRAAALDEARPTQRDVALLQYTGGTTGTAKGAVLTHGNLVANVLQAAEWAKPVVQEGREVVVTPLPLYHIFSLTVDCLLFTKLGGLNLLITNPRDIPNFVNELKASPPFTAITGVNTLYNALMNAPGFASVNFQSLKIAIGGAAAIHRVIAERWRTTTGCPLTEGYGLTEASPLVACNPLRKEYTGTIGLPMPSTEVAVRDSHDADLPAGTVGELCVRGPQVTSGYWRRPEESGVISPDGWLRTGDLATFDEHGYIRVTDRKKDVILVSGFNVYPAEVEDVIASIPGVLESAVVGVPDDITGEIVKAFVVASHPAPAPDVIIGHCRERLTSYKVPRQVEYRTELPKNPIGKVLRRELRPAVSAAQHHAAAGQASASR